ncbi:sulfotransferase family protein [Cytobacillus firmus]|uniref:sulfotransferase family 2 domain-containing protein n=1 Tax=Cytobacillus firmus TaxID=1399 RepID=UPI001C985E00|nr:sulfotransferase family 2 domain-containing protein [Cytobacillus firmus]MBY6053358.1 sulfotransferase family protein [Cytobacillus firmus]USK41229.1 sulfotransferase family protein [Cytobacillus firmus]
MTERQLIEEIIKFRIPNYHKDFPVIFFWSQKSGCTTLLKWFFFQIGLLDSATIYHPWPHFYEEEVFKTKNYRNEVIDSLISLKKETIKLVRNPYKRAVSQFLILTATKGNPYWEKEWEKIREFHYKDKYSKRGVSFRQFLIYIKENPNNIDDHFTPQYRLNEEKFVRKYMNLEHFTYQIGVLERKHGLRKSNQEDLAQSPHHLAKSMKLKGKFGNIEFTDETFNETNLFPTYESFYNLETTRLVNEIFHKDFEMYGYKMKTAGQ